MNRVNNIGRKKIFVASALALVFILTSAFALAQTIPISAVTIPSYQYNPFPYYGSDSATGVASAQYYFGGVNPEACQQGQGQDFVVQVLPGSCSPSVVRSDLLEEQPVTVFCRLTGTKINPLIEVPQIKSINLVTSQNPKGIRSILFHPYRAALQTTTAFDSLIGSPLISDLGYAVVVLNPIPVEKDMPSSIQANLTARILYDTTTTFGITNDALVLPVLTDDAWHNSYKQYGFWNGRAYVRASNIQENSAQISVYVSSDKPLRTFTLSKGAAPSPLVYMPGSYCASGLQVRLDDLVIPQNKATLSINNNKLDTIEKMRILDQRCTVNSINPSAYDVGGSVKITCPEGAYTLSRPSSSAQISVDGVPSEKAVSMGDSFKAKDASNTEKNYTVLFVGKYLLPGAGSSPDDMKIMIVKESPVKADEVSKINKAITSKFSEDSFFNGINNIGDLKAKLEEISQSNGAQVIINSQNFGGSSLDVISVKSIAQNTYSSLVENYYSLYTATYQDVAKNYPNEKVVEGNTSSNSQYYGEEALFQAASTARTLGKSLDELKILKDFIEKYPNSKVIDEAKQRISMIYANGDSTEANKLIFTGGKSYYVTLDEISRPDPAELSAELSIQGSREVFGLKALPADVPGWQVDIIEENAVTFTKISDISAGQAVPTPVRIVKGQKGNLVTSKGNIEVMVTNINFNKYAVVSVHPYSKEGETFANFTVNIGIEKRAIQLSPEQTKKLIGELDRTITQFEEVTKKLGEVVESWKKVCLAGSAALWAESFLENLQSGGAAIARNFAMREADIDGYKGYASWCNDKINWEKAGNANSFSTCIFNKRGDIDNIIDSREKIISEWNDVVATARKAEGVVTSDCTFGIICRDTVNQTKLTEVIQKNTLDKYNLGSITSTEGGIPNTLTGEQVSAAIGNFSNLYASKTIGFEDSKALDAEARSYQECHRTGGLESTSSYCQGIANSLHKRLSGYSALVEADRTRTASADVFKGLFGISVGTIPYVTSGQSVTAPIVDFKSLPDSTKFEGLTNKESLALIPFNLRPPQRAGGEAIHLLGYYAIAVSGAGNTPTGKVYKFDENQRVNLVSENEKSLVLGNVGSIVGRQACNYAQKTAEIRYWGSGPFTGYPALIPLGRATDGSYGWYAATKAYGDTLNVGLTNTKAYADSGQPTNFYIANVGPDGKADFGDTPSGDDQCSQYFSIGTTYSGQTELGGMTQAQTKAFVTKAQNCLKQATTQAKNAQPGQQINTECGNFPVGQIKSPSPPTECEDFMSPEKCALMYNMCDPVICPSSRCDLGGRYPVDNVIQTGIIGGLALCAPNFGSITEGGVMMPVCLTGVHAGLDNFVSIMKDTRKCLQESLDTGRNVGICDELKSVYMCEFFWREITPFIKTGVPQLIERTIYSGRGGGEYLTFAETYQSSINQVSYFTNYYGVNALKAFQARSTAEAGSLVCKAFVGLRYPDSANLFNELAKPESPPQYNAWFDEIPYSSVTVPATSQYKVYWHIFAGRDEPAYWSVYLKDPAFVPTINIPEQYVIQSGYTSKGESVDITRDLTGPAGYKQLCIRVNLKEECGFKKVTTGFATEELTNLYVQSQTVPDYAVKSEADCTSGTSTLLATNSLPESLIPAITQPGIGGVGEALQPSIYKRGIVRVCSSDDPGKANSPGRWSIVGFCDSQKKVGCWLDKSTVTGAISDLNLSATTLLDAQKLSNELLVSTSGYINAENSKTIYSGLRKDLDKLSSEINSLNKDQDSAQLESRITSLLNGNAVVQLNRIIKLSVSPRERARAELTLADIYRQIVLRLRSAPATPAATNEPIATGNVNDTTSAQAKKCTILSVAWNKQGSTFSGDELTATVVGSRDCIGLSTTVSVYEEDTSGFTDDFVVSMPATFNERGIAQAKWTAKWQSDGFISGDPEFYAKAFGGLELSQRSAAITVTGSSGSTVNLYNYALSEDITIAELASSLGITPASIIASNPGLQLQASSLIKKDTVKQIKVSLTVDQFNLIKNPIIKNNLFISN